MDTEMPGAGCSLNFDYRRPFRIMGMGMRLLIDDLAEEELKKATPGRVQGRSRRRCWSGRL